MRPIRYLGMGLESFYLFRLDEEYVVRESLVCGDVSWCRRKGLGSLFQRLFD
jgi:hypothetical protein